MHTARGQKEFDKQMSIHQRHNSDSIPNMRLSDFVKNPKYSNSSGGSGSNGVSSQRSKDRGGGGGGGGFWSNSSVPPRFERSKHASSNSNNSAVVPDHQYELDSNFETEELPNGFTKIRSKNLDVLFRKDYYAQRMLSTQVACRELWNFIVF